MSIFEYKGYIGSAEVDTEAGVLVGRLLFIRDVIAYSAENPKGLERAFREAVDDYLEACHEAGEEPEVPCKGSFNVRVEPHLHRTAALKARARRITLNQFVESAIAIACSDKTEHHTHLTVRVDQGLTRIASAGMTPEWEASHGYTH